MCIGFCILMFYYDLIETLPKTLDWIQLCRGFHRLVNVVDLWTSSTEFYFELVLTKNNSKTLYCNCLKRILLYKKNYFEHFINYLSRKHIWFFVPYNQPIFI